MSPRARAVVMIVTVGGLVAIGVWWAGRMIIDSAVPDAYVQRRFPDRPWVYPTRGVTVSIALLALECLAAAVVVACARDRVRRWARVGTGFIALGMGCAVVAMHGPVHVTYHMVWCGFAALWSFAAGGLEAAARRLTRARSPRP